ncbi:hypothetical protein SAMN05216197_16216, partial [Pseudomonas graminis]
APKVSKSACSWLGPSFVRVPSLRSRSVGPRRTDIHVLTALSPHPCGSTHCARPAFSLHPSRDWCRLDFLRTKIKSRSTASRLKPVLRSRSLRLLCDARDAFCGTGFSREGVSVLATTSLIVPHAPRGNASPNAPRHRSGWRNAHLKWDRFQPGRGQCVLHHFRGMPPDAFPAIAGPTGCSRCGGRHQNPARCAFLRRALAFSAV